MCPTWRWPQQQWPKHAVNVDKLYTPDIIVVLLLVCSYRIITLGTKYENLALDIKNIWKINKLSVYLFRISGEGEVTKSFSKYLEILGLSENKHLYYYKRVTFFFLCLCGPTRAMASSFLRFLDHTQRCVTVGRTPLDEWSARRRDL